MQINFNLDDNDPYNFMNGVLDSINKKYNSEEGVNGEQEERQSDESNS